MGDGVAVPLTGPEAASWHDGRSDIGRHDPGRRRTPQSPTEALQPEVAPPPPPKPPSRRRPTLSTLSGFLSFLVILAIGGLAAVSWGQAHLEQPGPLSADKVVFIEPHTDTAEIIATLENDGVIDNRWLFQTALVLLGKNGKVKSGEYMFRQHASMRAVIDEMVAGKHIAHAITIPEGLTSAQVVDRLRADDMLMGDIREIPKEGSLLPETYKFARGYSRSDLLLKMQEDDRRAIEQIWMRRSPDLPLRSPYELVTLASIVEKETGKADERPRVAGVFINRLQRHMRLQSDPTIVYGLVAGQGTLGHSITRSELDKRTPYNTYQIDGLPPGPIDNPGRAALEAVANPSRTGDLYFVADGTGGHAFSDSIDQHNRNVQRWRQIERDAKDKGDVDKVSPNAVAQPHGNQRSDAADPAFGVLPHAVATADLGLHTSLTERETRQRLADVMATELTSLDESADRHSHTSSVATLGETIDANGFASQVARTKAADLLDGPPTPEAPKPVAFAFPKAGEEAGRQAEAMLRDMKPEAGGAQGNAAQGSATQGDLKQQSSGAASRQAALAEAPRDQPVDLFSDDATAGPAPLVAMKTPPAHPKIFDVSEGTPLDPLKNHSYDLNTAKSIPSDLDK